MYVTVFRLSLLVGPRGKERDRWKEKKERADLRGVPFAAQGLKTVFQALWGRAVSCPALVGSWGWLERPPERKYGRKERLLVPIESFRVLSCMCMWVHVDNVTFQPEPVSCLVVLRFYSSTSNYFVHPFVLASPFHGGNKNGRNPWRKTWVRTDSQSVPRTKWVAVLLLASV